MKPVDVRELLPIAEYEAVREHFRGRVIEAKKMRRVTLGDRMTGVFENHDTVLLQVQEMLRTERITRADAILHEADTYNELIPRDRELSCSIMIEIADDGERERFLVAAKGIEQCFSILVGEETFPGRVREDRLLSDRASAVIYLKFALSRLAVQVLAAKGAVTLRAVHPAYDASVLLSPALVADLALESKSE